MAIKQPTFQRRRKQSADNLCSWDFGPIKLCTRVESSCPSLSSGKRKGAMELKPPQGKRGPQRCKLCISFRFKVLLGVFMTEMHPCSPDTDKEVLEEVTNYLLRQLCRLWRKFNALLHLSTSSFFIDLKSASDDWLIQ